MTQFDYPRFYAELDRIRQERGLTWYGVFKKTGVVMFMHPSTFLKKSHALHKTTRTEICTWAGLAEGDFLVESEVSA